jgi:DNA gyrase subunit B
MMVTQMIQRLGQRYNRAVLDQLIDLPRLEREQFNDASALEVWGATLAAQLNGRNGDRSKYRVHIENRDDRSSHLLVVTCQTHSLDHETRLGREFFDSPEYQKITELGSQLQGLLGEGAEIQRASRSQPIRSFQAAVEWLLNEAQRGLSIQRYKGLGEMNPDQLWDTTMNPETRRLLKVRIEDAIAADEVFTTLMGDQVEPRRDFIERNALQVSNLDI